MLLALSPGVAIRPSLSSPGLVEIAVGSGGQRFTHRFDEPRLVAFLLSLGEGRELAQCVELLQSFLPLDAVQAHNVIAALTECKILARPAAGGHDAEMWESSRWRDALDYHRATQDMIYDVDPKRYEASMKTLVETAAAGHDEPALGPFPCLEGAPRIPLQRSEALIGAAALGAVLRSAPPRHYLRPGPVELEQISELLQHAYGVQSEQDGILGPCYQRSSPSAGSLQPVEAYLLVNAIEPIPPGLYHYLTREHALELLRPGDLASELASVCFDSPQVPVAAAVVILTARWARNMWKYRYPRAYRMVHLDAGHLIRTHVLTASALGLASVLYPSWSATRCARFLGIHDDTDEGALCIIGIGL